jgi:hypothetical protein
MSRWSGASTSFVASNRHHPDRPSALLLLSLCDAANKYDVEGVARSALSQHASFLVGSDEPKLLILALLHRVPSVVTVFLNNNQHACECGEPCIFEDMPWQSIRLLPPAIFYRLFLEHHDGECTWHETSNEIRTVRSQLLASICPALVGSRAPAGPPLVRDRIGRGGHQAVRGGAHEETVSTFFHTPAALDLADTPSDPGQAKQSAVDLCLKVD